MIDMLNKVTTELGKLLIKWKNTSAIKGEWDGTQFKAKADLMAHCFIVEQLLKFDSSTPVLSEEDELSLVEQRPDRYYLIDPIDGTASYINGYNGYVTQVALIENNEITCSSIYAPELNELYYAKKGNGAFLNGKKLDCIHSNDIISIIDNYPKPQPLIKKIINALSIQNYIECGSLGLKIAKVASGSASLFVKDVIVKDWDIAPAKLLMDEIGRNIYDADGNEFKFSTDYSHNGIIASSSNICLDLIVGILLNEKE